MGPETDDKNGWIRVSTFPFVSPHGEYFFSDDEVYCFLVLSLLDTIYIKDLSEA